MRLILQRVTSGQVVVANEIVAQIQHGYVILLGVGHGDMQAQADWLAEKVAYLRVFEDGAGKMNRSLLDVGGSALVVSQFTLYADAVKGRRPAFTEAAPPEVAEPLVAYFVEKLRALGVPTQTGVFRAHMQVTIVNDGPVTIVLER